MKLKKINHPWWHWFFTSIISYGKTTIHCTPEIIYDIVTRYCSKCDKFVKDEKKRDFI